VEFITATVATVDQLGINFNMLPFPGATLTTGLNTPTAPTVSLTYAAGSTALSMLAALQKTHSKVVESPIITTTNNVAGTVQESQQIPYETTTTVLNGNGTGATTSTTQFLTVTTGLTVQPRINSDDTVTMQLNPQVSIPGLPTFGNGPPAVTTESASALRTIKSGETMVLGGLISKTDQRTQNRIPLLSDLPIIGSLFRDRNINDSDSELLIFVTPTIIGDDNETPIEQGDLVTP
jgi:type II secretory pathway component GspD/PulD (secretin)